MTESKPPPAEVVFRAGMIWAYVNREERNGDSKYPKRDIRILRRWWDPREKKYRTTTYFQPQDLPKLILVAGKAYEHIMLREVTDMPGQESKTGYVQGDAEHTDNS